MISRLNRLLLLGPLLSLFSCTYAIKPESFQNPSKKKAYVIMNTYGESPLTEARYCHPTCVEWYQLENKTSDVYIFPRKVGGSFAVNQIWSGGRYASVDSKPLKLKKPGIYYYATLVTSHTGVKFVDQHSDKTIQDAINKYGEGIKQLEPINFKWPEAAK